TSIDSDATETRIPLDAESSVQVPRRQGQRGYVVTCALLPSLEAELKRTGTKFIIVSELQGLGDYPRPVFVTDSQAPDGWSRYGACKRCGKGRGLSDHGWVRTVPFCLQCKETIENARP